ncbi:hypothetical protein LINPERHAP1_LOCUS25900 [Linum perenne]
MINWLTRSARRSRSLMTRLKAFINLGPRRWL